MSKNGYDSFVESFLRDYKGKNRGIIRFLLNSEDVKDSYKSLSGKVSREKINQIFRKSIRNVSGNSNPHEVVSDLSKNLARMGEHNEILDDFFRKGLIGKRHYEENKLRGVIVTKLGLKGGFRGKLVIGSLVLSGLFFIGSLVNGGFTGAVIGGGNVDLSAVYGSILFIFGLALAHFEYNKG